MEKFEFEDHKALKHFIRHAFQLIFEKVKPNEQLFCDQLFFRLIPHTRMGIKFALEALPTNDPMEIEIVTISLDGGIYKGRPDDPKGENKDQKMSSQLI